MSGFMRQHPDQLVRGLGLHDGAGVHENAAAVGDERVEGTVVDDHRLDVLFFQARGAQDLDGPRSGAVGPFSARAAVGHDDDSRARPGRRRFVHAPTVQNVLRRPAG